MSALIDYTSEENYVIITLNNGKVNAISHEVIDSLNQLLDKAETQKKVVILTGQPGVFSAGYDLKSMTTSPESALKLVTKGSKLSHRMLSFPTPIITACTGHAIAKGAFLLLSADYRLGAEGNFKIGFNEVLIGMTMHNAGVQIAKGRLTPNYVNRSVNNAEMYSPKDAVTAGFLDKIVPENQVLPTAIKIAEMFAKLNLKAHHQTKLKVRKTALRSLKKAIKKDVENGLNPPSK
ncbi:crotonase/enoyl-CoA hydratase family protein [Tenacibaculum finnmarkense]|uniref:Crotonase/enoyl-CoA hydratase family protein n=1 Tax=Tenacibaculum finnmarkense genomovar finnmarkense TaxID=1458503 RepID=A0AAP1RFN4_9FLAO|nr:crotonase/enoyl-CoA hydratase family protein [Tenacibaculum finnmarkense]MBE7652710.1 crotonase/enoyl-CoA hydratase family protein [Tenacibaculum finnmarkense genomovar finnmarkense]MBE7695013.1 crotonase/enoyl-CoA hydratase family protein [Tenacibaculum finnmarkense genomovar finnmarkense]MCD8427266.1 crotonase/enoyl-CoA hydratase family protein [Tenacibaculum finnmarkense genomovar finnmarkense]MCG8731079.1 crotonase/enoyl-CoA hydratase family protein [Tenacibaculum finnmarkense]MCG875118